MLTISRADILRLGGERAFAEAVAAFAAALEAHRFTVDVPAPTADSVIELVVRQHGGQFDIEPEPEPDPEPEQPPIAWRVSTYRIVRRLEAAGLIEAADAALDAQPVLFRRFYTAGTIPHDDPDAIAFLQGIGADPVIVLAPE